MEALKTDARKKEVGKKKQTFIKTLAQNGEFLIMVTPAIILLIIFAYWPMFGAVVAFKDFSYVKGILGSGWIGFKNFEFFFSSQDAVRITANTVGFGIVFIIASMASSIAVALVLFEVHSKKLLKYYQTTMILPHFMSWVVVAYIAYVIFNQNYGIANTIIRFFGGEGIDWYTEPNWWRIILPVFHVWKGVGVGCIIYYATLIGIDPSLFEAAKIDGANKWQQTMNISIPSLVPMMSIMLIMAMGNILKGDFGLFYQLPMDIGVLYPVTDIIDTYIYRGLRTGEIGVTAAVGFFQSFVGLCMILITNFIIKRVDSERAMF